MFQLLSRLFRWPQPNEAGWIEADALRSRSRPVLLIDVRQPEEFSAAPGHLPGAMNVPLATLESRIGEISSHGKPIVLVCKTDRRSATAAGMLLAAGLKDVSVLRGGTDGWHRQGLPLD